MGKRTAKRKVAAGGRSRRETSPGNFIRGCSTGGQYLVSGIPLPSNNLHDATLNLCCTRVGTLIVAAIYLQLTQNRYMFRSFTLLQCSHQHCVQPVASDVEVVGYL